MYREIRARVVHGGDAGREPGARDAGGAGTSAPAFRFGMSFVLNEKKVFIDAYMSLVGGLRDALYDACPSRATSAPPPIPVSTTSAYASRGFGSIFAPPLNAATSAEMNVTPSAPPNPKTNICPIARPTVGRPARSNGVDSASTGGGSVATFPLGFAAPSAVVWFVTLFHQYDAPVAGSRTSVHCTTAGDVSDRRCLPGARRADLAYPLWVAPNASPAHATSPTRCIARRATVRSEPRTIAVAARAARWRALSQV